MPHATTTLISLALSAVVLLRETVAQATEAQCEALPPSTLTFQCDNQCDAYEPCYPDTTSGCQLTCMDAIYDQAKNFELLVPFGKWKSAQELADPNTQVAILGDDVSKYENLNNDELETIAAFNLSSATTTVSIIGGSVFALNTKGHVASVTLSTSLLTGSPQVVTVALSNLELETQANAIAKLLPPKVQNLSLDNTLLDEFPKGLGNFETLTILGFRNNYLSKVGAVAGFGSLTTLWLTSNNIKSFIAVFPKLATLDLGGNLLSEFPDVLSQYPAITELWLNNNNISVINESHALPTLTSLYASYNQISTFDALFPNLTTLDLSSNELTEIPPIIFEYTTLSDLQLANNALSNVTLTLAQADFLGNLTSFSFDKTSISENCLTAQLREVHNMLFCMSDAPVPVDTHSSHHMLSTGAIIGIVAGALVLVLIIVWMCIRTRKLKKAAKDAYTLNEGTVSTMSGNGTGTVSLWQDVDMLSVKVNAEEIEDVKMIGKGAYGDVWLVKYRKTQLLASKRLRKSEANRSRIKSFSQEIKLVAKLEHPNIVSFVGAAWTIESDLQALFEYMEGGDLRDYLESPNTPREWSPEKIQIAIDVVEALVYVHSFSPPLVHRDLKSRNVLLSSELQAKLTDFGVSRFRSEDNTMTSGVGTGKWLAPEVISGSTDYGPAADIFSFGAVLSELDSHKLPYDELRGPNGMKLADVALLQMVATGQAKPSLSASCPPKIVELANRCFSFNPSERPAAAEIAYALRVLKRSTIVAL